MRQQEAIFGLVVILAIAAQTLAKQNFFTFGFSDSDDAQESSPVSGLFDMGHKVIGGFTHMFGQLPFFGSSGDASDKDQSGNSGDRSSKDGEVAVPSDKTAASKLTAEDAESSDIRIGA